MGDLPDDPTPVEPTPEIPDELSQLRAFIIASLPGIVPELIQGETISQLMASIQPACDAYTRIAQQVPAITVPAGGNAPLLINADDLPTAEKIRRGLAASRKDT